MGYADLNAVRSILDLEEAFAAQATDADARLAALDDAMSAIFDDKCNRTWGGEAAPRTVAITVERWHRELVLPEPGITAIDQVTYWPDWDGESWTGGTVVEADELVPLWQDPDGAHHGLWRPGGWPAGTLLVAATWADGAGDPVPAEVTEALTFIVAEEYRMERSSPDGTSGPDGMTVAARNPWRYERVQAVIAKYRIPDEVVL